MQELVLLKKQLNASESMLQKSWLEFPAGELEMLAAADEYVAVQSTKLELVGGVGIPPVVGRATRDGEWNLSS